MLWGSQWDNACQVASSECYVGVSYFCGNNAKAWYVFLNVGLPYSLQGFGFFFFSVWLLSCFLCLLTWLWLNSVKLLSGDLGPGPVSRPSQPSQAKQRGGFLPLSSCCIFPVRISQIPWLWRCCLPHGGLCGLGKYLSGDWATEGKTVSLKAPLIIAKSQVSHELCCLRGGLRERSPVLLNFLLDVLNDTHTALKVVGNL